MTHDEAFLESIREDPDDDGVRLIYADYLEDKGDPRGEFIRVQVELARMGQEDPRWPIYRRRERELLEAHWEAWTRSLEKVLFGSRLGTMAFPRPDLLSCFHRGFVEVWTTSAQEFVERGDEVFRLAPIRCVRLLGGSLLEEVMDCPWLRYVESLEFIGFYTDAVRWDGASILARSPHLVRLSRLNLQRNDIADDGLRALSEAPWLAGLRSLNLVDNGLSEEGIEALAQAHLPALADLRLGGNLPGRAWTHLIHSPVVGRLTRLDASGCNLSTTDLVSLLESPGLHRLAHLDLGCNPLAVEGALLLASSPLLGQLTSLLLDRCDLGDEGVEALVGSPHLGHLQALDLRRNGLTERGARVLVEAGLWDRVQVEEVDAATGESLLGQTRP